jgi:hypothetical protein
LKIRPGMLARGVGLNYFCIQHEMQLPCRNGGLLMNDQGFTTDPRASSRPEDFVPNRETCA